MRKPVGSSSGPQNRITILYDAFGKDASMRKDWGFSALVEIAGKRILFDTGDDRDIFAANVKAKNVDLTKLDFVVLSHRHGDHMAGLAHVLSVNPKVKIYAPKEGLGGIYGSSIPSSFYRKDNSLPPEMRYYDGRPPDVLKLGTAWQDANFELIDKTTEIAPGITLIALVSETPGTKELKVHAGRWSLRRHAEANDGYEPTLAAATKNLGDRVGITIRDNGTVPPDVKEKMFNPFFTTKPAGEGTGLGLSISHDIIVKQHGGSIEVDTQPGEFTEIKVVLPRVAALLPERS
jgi:hypothetical protein